MKRVIQIIDKHTKQVEETIDVSDESNPDYLLRAVLQNLNRQEYTAKFATVPDEETE